MPGQASWYCVHTRPQGELRVASWLDNQLGLETYFPRLVRQKTIRRVEKVVTGPLFPRYLFCRFDIASHFRAVRFAPDVIDVVAFGGGPALVRDSIITELKTWAGDAIDHIVLQPEFRPGDPVQITAGPLRGLQAVILDGRTDRDRVAVLLSLLNCEARTVIDRGLIARAG